MKDTLFNEAFSEIDAFAFDEKVVAVFPDMIKRSVPGYDTILKGIAMMAMRYVTPGSHVYDLGSSLGAVTLTVDQSIQSRDVTIHAVDNSSAMVQGMRQKLQEVDLANQILVTEDDLINVHMDAASFVVSNFTLQFMAPSAREPICEKIHAALDPGGVFVLSEKVISSDLLIDHYHGYKKVNGYSDLEIAQKRQALEDALRPDSVETWEGRLKAVGFETVEVWFRAFNFVSIVAIK